MTRVEFKGLDNQYIKDLFCYYKIMPDQHSLTIDLLNKVINYRRVASEANLFELVEINRVAQNKRAIMALC